MNRLGIAAQYARGWLTLDFLIVGIDWGIIIVNATASSEDSSGTDAARAGRMVRIARMLRLLRLMRLAKLRNLLFTIQSLVDSEWLTIVFAVVKNLGFILALNHFLACLFFLIGRLGEDDGWVTVADLEESETGVKYLVSLHWSLAQFSPGASPVKPQTLGERILAVSILCTGFVVATCFVSSITSTLSAVWAMNRYNSTQVFLLKKFLHQNSISRQLVARVTRYVDYVVELRHKHVHSSKVHYLGFLSGPLHVELQSEVNQPHILTHPLFPPFKAASAAATRDVCSAALTQIQYAKHDTVFSRNTGEAAQNMYFLNTGTLVYRVKRINRRMVLKLETGHWCVENTLWMPWAHTGDMKALTDVDTTLLNSQKFVDTTTKYPDALALARAYCRRFASFVQKVASFDLTAVCDLPHEVVAGHVDNGDNYNSKASVMDLKAAEDMEAQQIEWLDSDSDSDDNDNETTMD